MHPFFDAFEALVEADPDRPALGDPTLTLTRGQLWTAAAGLARHVANATERPHVGVLAPCSSSAAVSILACWYAGRVPVPLNFMLAPAELAAIVADAELDLVLVAEPLAALGAALGTRTLVPPATAAARTAPEPAPARAPAGARGDLAVLIYTSGTSARPKGVRLTFANLIDNAQAGAQHAAIDGNEVFLATIPPFHSFGFTMLIVLPLWVGARTWCLPRFSPVAVVDALAAQRVTVFPAIASMFAALTRLKHVPREKLTALRLPISGGEPLARPVADQFAERFGVPLLEGYGLTETSPLVAFNLPGSNRPGSVGRPIPGVEVVAADEHARPLAPGVQGELLIRGHCVMQGYHRQPQATADTLRAGWLHTGDAGLVDADGFIFITGRKKEMLIVGGENVYPREIEAVLLDHPAVLEAAVIGVADEVRGQTPLAFVELREGQSASGAELREWCRGRLAAYKCPRQVIVAPLPRGPTGKVLKRELRGP